MSISILIIMTIVCIFTAGISAVFGMAGGVIVFLILGFFVDLPTAIALHAVIQFISNFSRILIAFKSINWYTVFWFSFLLIPFAYLGSLSLTYFNEYYLQIFVGLCIIASVLIPKKGKNKIAAPAWLLVLFGAICSYLSMLVGAIGPLLSAFLNQTDLKKEALVSSKAMAQILNHLVKIIMMSAVIDFDYAAYQQEILILSIATIIGSVIGNKILKKINDNVYDKLNDWILIILASIMISKAALSLIYA